MQTSTVFIHIDAQTLAAGKISDAILDDLHRFYFNEQSGRHTSDFYLTADILPTTNIEDIRTQLEQLEAIIADAKTHGITVKKVITPFDYTSGNTLGFGLQLMQDLAQKDDAHAKAVLQLYEIYDQLFLHNHNKTLPDNCLEISQNLDSLDLESLKDEDEDEDEDKHAHKDNALGLVKVKDALSTQSWSDYFKDRTNKDWTKQLPHHEALQQLDTHSAMLAYHLNKVSQGLIDKPEVIQLIGSPLSNEAVQQLEAAGEIPIHTLNSHPINARGFSLYAELVLSALSNTNTGEFQATLKEQLDTIDAHVQDPHAHLAVRQFLQTLLTFTKNPIDADQKEALRNACITILGNAHEQVRPLGFICAELTENLANEQLQTALRDACIKALHSKNAAISDQAKTYARLLHERNTEMELLLEALEAHQRRYHQLPIVGNEIKKLITDLKTLASTDAPQAKLDAQITLDFLNDPSNPDKLKALHTQANKTKGHPKKLIRNIAVAMLVIGAVVSALAVLAYVAPITFATSLTILLAAKVVLAVKAAIATGGTLTGVGLGLFAHNRQKNVSQDMAHIQDTITKEQAEPEGLSTVAQG